MQLFVCERLIENGCTDFYSSDADMVQSKFGKVKSFEFAEFHFYFSTFYEEKFKNVLNENSCEKMFNLGNFHPFI